MASQALPLPGIAIPPEEIHSALSSAAVPGYTGSLQIEFSVQPEAARHVMIAVIRRQSKSTQEVTREIVPAVGAETARKKSVQRVLTDLQQKLRLRPVVLAIEAQYVDGELKKYTVME
ncbi:MAG TPA: hypothetical protein VHA33_29275 [Candidatus Angelobacter sp.]|jgi:hypothetical protein|nr:hypothetical protein [Candidatus Angelobacter sp.]